MRKIWPFSFSFVSFMGTAFVLPFLVLYYQGLGFSGAQIGLLTGLTPLITLFAAPLWTGLADATRRHRLIMSATLLLGAGTIALFPFFKLFAPILLLAVLFNLFFAPSTRTKSGTGTRKLIPRWPALTQIRSCCVAGLSR